MIRMPWSVGSPCRSATVQRDSSAARFGVLACWTSFPLRAMKFQLNIRLTSIVLVLWVALSTITPPCANAFSVQHEDRERLDTASVLEVASEPTEANAEGRTAAIDAAVSALRDQLLDERQELLGVVLQLVTLVVAMFGIAIPLVTFLLGRHFYGTFKARAKEAADEAGRALEAASAAAGKAARTQDELDQVRADTERRFDQIRRIAAE